MNILLESAGAALVVLFLFVITLVTLVLLHKFLQKNKPTILSEKPLTKTDGQVSNKNVKQAQSFENSGNIKSSVENIPSDNLEEQKNYVLDKAVEKIFFPPEEKQLGYRILGFYLACVGSLKVGTARKKEAIQLLKERIKTTKKNISDDLVDAEISKFNNLIKTPEYHEAKDPSTTANHLKRVYQIFVEAKWIEASKQVFKDYKDFCKEHNLNLPKQS